MSFVRFAVTMAIRFLISAICRVDARAFRAAPRRGPFILAINHINFLEVPLVYSFLYPRRVIGMAKRETWDNPVLGALGDLWEAIPLERGKSDVSALHAAVKVLDKGGIVVIAPEGTRSVSGALRRGHPGIVTIASISGAPVIPLAHWGGERFWKNLKAFRRTGIKARIGEPFIIKADANGLTHAARQDLADQVMNRISALMPEKYRGAYPAPESAARDGLEFQASVTGS
jgi:1-acyl-sn-glycerol-3-phosphate acyltransferase